MAPAETVPQPVDRGAAEGPLYASVDGLVAPLSNQECVFQHRETGESHVMTNEVLTAMDACRNFRPLAEHIGAVETTLPALKGKREAISQVLRFLIARGLMVSDRQMTETLRAAAPKEQPEPAALMIRTCDRPNELTRLLDSVKAYEARFSRGLKYVIVDDSRAAESVARNATAVAALEATGIGAYHLDRDWRSRLAAHCESQSVCNGQAARLLGITADDEFTGGAAANAGLLLTAGAPMLQLDDDFLIQPKQRAAADRGLGLPEPAQIPVHFEPEMESLAASLEDYDSDPLAAHIGVCGQPAGHLLAAQFGLTLAPRTWFGASFQDAQSVVRCDAIKTTTGGYWGDSAMDTTLWYYLFPGQYTRSFWSDPDRYRSLLSRPLLAQGFNRMQLAQMSNFSPVCVDNSELVPCMPPTGRGEDYGFSAWMRYLYPDSLTVHMPWMLRHERPPAAGESPHAHAFVPWFSRFAGEYALSLLEHCHADSAEQRVQALIALYRDLAAASEKHRLRVLREFLAYLRAQVVRRLQQAMQTQPVPPEYWLQDAREWIAENGKALDQPGSPRLRDWPLDSDEAACAAALTRDLQRCADALEAWPQMWQYCRGRFAELLTL